MARVLLVDTDSTTQSQTGEILRRTGHRFDCASSGRDGIRAVERFDPHIVLIGLVLPDMSGIDCLREIRGNTPWVAGVILSTSPAFESAKEALRIGACDWLDKPIRKEELLDSIRRASMGNGHAAAGLQLKPGKPHAAARLAAASVAFIGAPEDAPTLQRFGREVGHSLGCLRNWCSVAHLKSKSFCDFSRGLRSIYRLQYGAATKQTNVLEIVDRRTLKRFVATSGGSDLQLPATVDEFLDHQRFIPQPDFLAAVRRALKARLTVSASSGTHVDECERQNWTDSAGDAVRMLTALPESLVELESNRAAGEPNCAGRLDSAS